MIALDAKQIIEGHFYPAFEVDSKENVQNYLPDVDLANREELLELIPKMIEDPKSYQVKHPEFLEKVLESESAFLI